MRIELTALYPLWSLSMVVASNCLNVGWDSSYESVKIKGQSYRYPGSGGAGQKIRSPKLLPRELLPDAVAALDDGRKGIVYVLCSTIYPILYVGISRGTLRHGVFGAGRFGHHIRKVFACHASQTSHTEGWPAHAIERYRDRVLADREPKSRTALNWQGTMIGEDLMLAFGAVEGPWDPAKFEGTVLDAMLASFAWDSPWCQGLNTGTVKRTPAEIQVPRNLDEILQTQRNFRGLSEKPRLARISVNEMPLDIESVARHCRLRQSVDPGILDRIARCMAGDFKELWNDQWRDRLLEMAEEWSNIEMSSLIAVSVAQQGGHLKSKIVDQFNEIFDQYEAATRVMLRDGDDGYQWKLEPIQALRRSIEGTRA